MALAGPPGGQGGSATHPCPEEYRYATAHMAVRGKWGGGRLARWQQSSPARRARQAVERAPIRGGRDGGRIQLFGGQKGCQEVHREGETHIYIIPHSGGKILGVSRVSHKSPLTSVLYSRRARPGRRTTGSRLGVATADWRWAKGGGVEGRGPPSLSFSPGKLRHRESGKAQQELKLDFANWGSASWSTPSVPTWLLQPTSASLGEATKATAPTAVTLMATPFESFPRAVE